MTLKSPRKRWNRGFTLIELLVVVAIIALLISILLPSLHRAKKSARQVYCLSNLRTIGQAATYYAEENADMLPRGIQIFTGNTRTEYHIFATAILKWVASDYDGPEHHLWEPRGMSRGDLNRTLRATKVLQCPDYPYYETRHPQQQKASNPMDYVSSAMPIPYTQNNFVYDQGHLEWDPDDDHQGVFADADTFYSDSFKLDDMPVEKNPSDIIYVTEAHVSLPWTGSGPRLHHFFLAQHLPFAERPRIANDQRHPNGINALSFAGSARSMDPHEMDPAWPNPLDQRLRWFTVLPEEWLTW